MKDQSLRVLIVEDSEDDTLLVLRALKKGGYNPLHERVETAAAMKKALKEKQWDIILCDYKMSKFSGKQAFALLQETNIDIPLIIVSGTMGEEAAAECMRLGAQDYIMKGNLSRLCPAIARELKEAEVKNEQKQMESQREAAIKSLRESEEKYRLIFEYSPLGLLSFDEKGVIVACNDNFVKIIGSSREKLVGLNMLKLPNKNIVSAVRKALQGSTGLYEGDYSSVTAKKITSVRCLFEPMDVGGGRISGGVGIIEDITERKQADESLQKSEEQYRALVENARDIVFRTDGTGHYTFVNPAAVSITGYSEEELIGKHFKMLIRPDKYKEAMKVLVGQYENRIPNTYYEFPFITKDGHEVWIGENTQLIVEDGNVIGFQAVARDITERKQMEETLQQSEEKYRTILETIQEGYFEVDLTGNFTFFNDSLSRILGHPSEEMLGLNDQQYADKDNAKNFFKRLIKFTTPGNPPKDSIGRL